MDCYLENTPSGQRQLHNQDRALDMDKGLLGARSFGRYPSSRMLHVTTTRNSGISQYRAIQHAYARFTCRAKGLALPNRIAAVHDEVVSCDEGRCL